MKLVTHTNEILKERMPEFDFNNSNEDPKLLESEMLKIMYEENGIGLSANQVGKRTRVFVMGNKTYPNAGKAFFNPMVISVSENLIEHEEGCLSFPNVYVKVKRPYAIKARWQNSSGEWEEGEFHDYACKCFLHELDHLEGITFQDRVSPLKWKLAIKKIKKRKYNGGT